MISIHEEITEPIEIFERLFKCHLSFHDYTGAVKKNFRMFNFVHLNRFCESVKKCGESACVSFDFYSAQAELFIRRKAFFKICHAGVLELAVPIFIKEQLSGAMFAGPFRISSATVRVKNVFRKTGTISPNGGLRKIYTQLTELDSVDLETLKCFALLLVRNIERCAAIIAGGGGIPSGRAGKIRFFIENNFRKNPSLSDLAKYMGLSVPRISQLLKEFFGKGISYLVMEEKIKHAERLLCNSYFTMEAIAGECGFSDPSYFFRAFSKLRGITPGAFRKKNAQTDTPI